MGVFQFFYEGYKKEMEKPLSLTVKESIAARQELMAFVKPKIDAAKTKVATGKRYEAVEYYTDLSEVYLLSNTLGYYSHDVTKELFEISFNQKIRYSQTEIDNGRLIYARLTNNKPMLYQLEGPQKTTGETLIEFKKFFEEIFSLWPRLARHYAVNMPLAIILFFLWFLGDPDDRKWLGFKFSWPKPWKFALAVIFYPIVIAVVWGRKLKEDTWNSIGQARIRQTKENIFGILSDEELEKIKKLTKGTVSLANFRLELATEGLTPRHSFILALSVTIFLMIIPRLGFSETRMFIDTSPVTVIEKSSQQHLPRMGIDDEGNGWHLDLEIIEVFKISFIPKLVGWIQYCKALKLMENYQKILHVPIRSVAQPNEVS
jgi:hypothetical protein